MGTLSHWRDPGKLVSLDVPDAAPVAILISAYDGSEQTCNFGIRGARDTLSDEAQSCRMA